MTAWQFTSPPDENGNATLTVDLTSDDATGNWNGTANFRGTPYKVTGQWAAAGSVPGRNDSIFWFGGTNAEASAFLVAAGDLFFDPQAYDSMQIAVTTASAGDGQDYGYNGKLTRTNSPDDPDFPEG
jgi:hypothetical protein